MPDRRRGGRARVACLRKIPQSPARRDCPLAMPHMPKSIHRHHALRSSGLLGSPLRNLVFGVSFTLVVIMLATIAYWLAGWPFGDAVYMVIVTVYSVGYGEVRPAATPLLRGIT